MPRRALVLIALALGGCTAEPSPTATPPVTDEQVCRSLISAVPSTVDHEAESARSEFAVAWGDPPIVLRCGVEVPSAYGPTSEMLVVNKVSWFAQQQPDGYVFTAVGRTPLVSVQVPDTHQPEVNPLVDLAPVMLEQTQVSGPAGAAP
ncbi:MAG TPA: DUF3515 family protein [Actinomycetota bacterium]|nr:DUF3515 family protein [Actinomycetota bacterium]